MKLVTVAALILLPATALFGQTDTPIKPPAIPASPAPGRARSSGPHASAGAADLLTLQLGQQLACAVESGDNATIEIQVGDHHRPIALHSIRSIRFGPPADRPATLARNGLALPAGTEIAVRTVDRIESRKAGMFHEYAASLDDPIVVTGVTVAPADASAFLRAEIRYGSLGRASLSVVLEAVVINGRRIEVKTGAVDSQSGSRAKRAPAATALDAAGTGAGAGADAAAGTTGGIVKTRGVEIAPDVRFTFKLEEAGILDSLALRNGTIVTGTWSGVDAQQVSFRASGQDTTYPRSDVLQVDFTPRSMFPRGMMREMPPLAAPQAATPPAPADRNSLTISLSQTIDEVTAVLGQPITIVDMGVRKIYIFKKLKVTFTAGKVTSIQ